MKITSFDMAYRFLSNFHPSNVEFEGLLYPSVEAAYQAAKSLNPEVRLLLADETVTGSRAKKIGKTLDLRPDWEQAKLGIMRELVEKKFSDPELRAMLLATGERELIEGNWWHDQFWGNCNCLKHLHHPGQNHLGRILMEVRERIRLELEL